MNDDSLFETQLALPGLRRGKVRDVYDLPGQEPRLLLVATDRISAFDVVMPAPISGKGRLLTELSTFWFRFIERRAICRTHVLSTNVESLPEAIFEAGGTTRSQLAGRSTIARKARVIPIECVVRGYLEGSGWREYQASSSVCGIALPKGLRQCDQLPEPIFTPATKEVAGKHDENVSFERACELVGRSTMDRLRSFSLQIYGEAARFALQRGIIIADTKFEFGVLSDSDDIILIDEALTPDSSRFWPADSYSPGRSQASFDKQFLREYLESLVAKGIWNKTAPGPDLPLDVVAGTLTRYQEAVQRLTQNTP
jgi:phosphoribosylaminoimidazole-succinocarboxamide synthase